MEQRNENKTELKMIKMSDVQSQTVDWLWYPFIPYGKLTIIQGDPGDGKTTLILNIAARLSKGEGLEVLVHDKWVRTRMEMNPAREWYLVGTPYCGDLEYVQARIPE